MSSEQEQVQVRFTTQQEEYAVNDAAILLPSNIKKEGLSEIVNSLLDNGKSRSFCQVERSRKINFFYNR